MAGGYALRKLIDDLQVLQKECDPDGAVDKKKENDLKLDSFEVAKRDLNFIIVDLKKNVQKRNEMVQNHGRHEQTIRLKSENEKMLVRAKEKFNEMKRAYDMQMKKKRKRLADDVLESRKRFVDLFETEIRDIEAMHERHRPRRGSQRSLARSLQENRRKEREDARARGDPDPIEMKEMTATTQVFMLEKEANDAVLDEKLDLIHGGIKDLHNIALDMGNELEVQKVIMDETNKQMDVLDDKFKSANARMSRLLEESGGSARWCMLMIAFIILMALTAYIFNIV